MVIHPYIAKLSLGLGLAIAFIHPAFSQITPNGAGTVVNPQGNQINITGGTQTGANLFHSFQDFNINSSQVANFLSNPQTQNILGRINGGNPSVINGLLQVTGGSSNLFLMNPAGIIFGQGASLNIPASFTATTANGIGFGNSVFNAFGDNNFSAITGNPDSFLFTTNQAGSIVNAGNLAVGNSQNISLIAGNTINTGRLTAPGGEIQVLAVPGTNRVRLSQPGQVLSLEFVPPVSHELRALDLPTLLTGSNLNGIQVDESSQVQVAGINLPNQQGLAIASGRIDVSSATGIGGTVQVMGDRVAALNSRINANGATGGGTVRLGGEYLGGINTGIAPALRFNAQRTLVDRNSLIRVNATNTGAGGRAIVWADDTTGFYGRITGRGATERGGFVEVSGKVNLDFDGRVELPGANGLFGTLLLDPTNITIVAGANNSQPDDTQVNLDATILTGDLPANMTISAGALAAIPANTNISLAASNNINVTTSVTFDPCTTGVCGAISFTAGGTFDSGSFGLNNITAQGRDLSITAPNIIAVNFFTSTSTPLRNGGNVTLHATGGNISLTAISTGSASGVSGAINFNATGNIIQGSFLNTNSNTGTGGNMTFNAGGSISLAGQVSALNNTTGNSGSISLTAGNNISAAALRTNSASGDGGSITVNAGNNINITDFIATVSGGGGGNGGAINLTAGGNITTTLEINSTSATGNAGAITIDAGGSMALAGAVTAVNINTGSGGAINLTAQGNIAASNVRAYANTGGDAGAITIDAGGSINLTNDVDTRNISTGNSGAISLTAVNDISTASLLSATNNGDSGSITVAAGNNINITNLISSLSNNMGDSGAINLTAGGNIATSNIDAFANMGSTGAISLTAQGNITTPNISTYTVGGGNAGAIDVDAGGSIALSGLVTTSNLSAGNSGAISLTAQGNITASNVQATASNGDSGAIAMNAGGNLGLTGTVTTSNLNAGNAGAIGLTAQGNITTSNISTSTISGNSGAVTFNAPQGSMTTGTISTIVSNGNGAAGAVNLTSLGNISTNDITTSTNNGIANGGVVNLTSQGSITTGNIATGTSTGSGGAVNLNAPNGNIVANSIYTPGGGSGYSSGVINVNAGNLVRVVGSSSHCSASAASICTVALGGASDGAVTIRHGGRTVTPFTIGNSSTNGTAQQINAGAGSNILPTFEVPMTSSIYTQGIVQIITDIPPAVVPPIIIPLLPTPEPPPPVIVGTPPEPVVETPIIPTPTPSPVASPLPSPIVSPTPSPVPSPTPLPVSSPPPTPSVSSSLRTSLAGINVSPQFSELTSEPSPGSFFLIMNPTIEEIAPRLNVLEQSFQSELQQYLGAIAQGNSSQNLQETQAILNQITRDAAVKPGLIYVFFAPPEGDGNFSSIALASQTNRAARDTDILEVVVITGTGEPIRVRLPGTTRRQVVQVANNFRSEVTNFRNPRGFLASAQQMYKWILEPLETELQKQGIDNLVFLMDAGLRSIPLAAMHDGQGFIVERYSVGLMPSLHLTPLDHKPLDGAQVLAMGADTFGNSGLNPLPAVPLELNTISQLWQGSEFLNENFTLNNLIQQRQNQPFRIIHLATHGVFNPGDRANSYIQLWDQRLRLDQLDQLNWGDPPVDLLVLSACQTALGDKEAELGFAGLAINAGVRSALASLWEVNDAATLGLMTKFYQQLQVVSTKSEALRQAQLAMIRGEVRLENGNLVTADRSFPLSEEVRGLGNLNLSHPYYWSAFTMVGNPW